MRKRLFILSAALLAVGIAVLLIYYLDCRNDFTGRFTRNVAIINGEPLTAAEYQAYLDKNAIIFSQYFKEKYGVTEINPEFWSKTFDGITPLEFAKKKALDECIRTKVQEVLAKQKGLVNDINYSTVLRNLAAENKRRKKAVSNGQKITGLLQIDEYTYFDSFFRSLADQLKKKLIEDKEIIISGKDIENYYEANKEAEFKEMPTMEIQRIYASFKDTNGADSLEEDAREKIGQVKARLDHGEKFDDLIKLYKNNTGNAVIYRDMTITEDTAPTDVNECLKIIEAARELTVNQVSDIIKQDHLDYNIIRCVRKEDNGYSLPSDNTVRNFIIEKLTLQKYNSFIDDAVKNCKMEINTAVFDKICIDERHMTLY